MKKNVKPKFVPKTTVIKKNNTNIEPPCNTEKGGSLPKRIQEVQRYRWEFTLKHTFEENDKKRVPVEPENLHSLLKSCCKEFFFQLEEGESGENPIGYLHYQGCFSLNDKMRRSGIKDILGIKYIHLEPCENWNALKKYSTKVETRIDGPWDINSSFLKTLEILRPWQQSVKTYCTESVPNDRTINWIVDPPGNKGKTQFIKFMTIKHNATPLISGRGGDVARCLGDNPIICLVNVPRTAENSGTFNYTILEQIKDGLVFDSKYESRVRVFNSPHIWVFANWPPNLSTMSQDRWVLWTITNDNILAPYEIKNSSVDESIFK